MESSDEPQPPVRHVVAPEIVTLPREIDIDNAPNVGRELLGAFGSPATVVIADMSLTDFCASAGIRCLLEANDAARTSGGELRIVVGSPGVLRVMRIMGVDQVLRTYSTLSEALTGKPPLEEGAG